MASTSSHTEVTRRLLPEAVTRYGSIDEDADDESQHSDTESYDHNVDLAEFPSRTRRRIALGIILLCVMFCNATFVMLVIWIPKVIKTDFAIAGSKTGTTPEEFQSFMQTVDMVVIVGSILIYSCSGIAGVLMDSVFKKLPFAFIVVLLSCAMTLGIGIILAESVSMSVDSCKTFNSTCDTSMFGYCQNIYGPGSDGYCIGLYTCFVYVIATLNSVVWTALPVLGGDQIPDRNGVRVFYALYWWWIKVGDTVATSVIFYNFYTKDLSEKNYKDFHSITLFDNLGLFVSITSGMCLLVLFIVVCGRVIREVNPDISVIQDTYGMWRQGYARRREREEDDKSCLDLAKISRGGNFPDQAVDDRIQLNKFLVALLLLIIPLEFGPELFTLYLSPRHIDGPLNESEALQLYHDIKNNVALNMIRHITTVIAIPVIHIICTRLVRYGCSPTLLYRFICGHATSILAITLSLIFDKPHTLTPSIAPAVLYGISSAFIYTAAYELTLLSAPRAMQGTAMGMLSSVRTVASLLALIIQVVINATVTTSYINPVYNYLRGGGSIATMAIAAVLIIVIERRYQLGLNRV